jgi:hypothetical protein
MAGWRIPAEVKQLDMEFWRCDQQAWCDQFVRWKPGSVVLRPRALNKGGPVAPANEPLCRRVKGTANPQDHLLVTA